MIFLAVGTQLPFDRLVGAVDDWAVGRGRTDVIGQIGATNLVPKAMRASAFVDPVDFTARCREASLLIAHAGMGSILGALEIGKPIIIMPRLASMGEHRNDHQLATARRFQGKPGVYVALDVEELHALLDRADTLTGGEGISSSATPELIGALRDFIATV